ncbi:MAG TPA: outer membrane beta-barrel protein [Chitinophagaceae bacterium]|nr:outer membrane beta-barrel protein [Chitinophagaceae bacterium]
MKKILFITLLFLLSLNSYAQTRELGIKTGLVHTSIASNAFFATVEPLYTMHAGVSFSQYFHKRWFIGANVLGGKRGFTRETMVNNQSLLLEDSLYHQQKLSYSYISLPLFFGYKSTQRLHVLAHGGLCVSALLRAKASLPKAGTNGLYQKDTLVTMTPYVKKFDLAWQAEVGLGYDFSNKMGVAIAVRNTRSFISHHQGEYFAILDTSNREWFRIMHNLLGIYVDIKYFF